MKRIPKQEYTVGMADPRQHNPEGMAGHPSSQELTVGHRCGLTIRAAGHHLPTITYFGRLANTTAASSDCCQEPKNPDGFGAILTAVGSRPDGLPV